MKAKKKMMTTTEEETGRVTSSYEMAVPRGYQRISEVLKQIGKQSCRSGREKEPTTIAATEQQPQLRLCGSRTDSVGDVVKHTGRRRQYRALANNVLQLGC
ncbi:hypothetical protein MLD38_021385 [Melastoma candidum]|uniref:Uncharacterized protein n=1 Tax=Melastoma candidum TaxID=119954 RepID=A0ACB9QFC0_9MYRT|nr:hypothetical protein MLD38_021385 [Melastoma candidum]